MPYIVPEIITEARRMDLLTYLRAYEPNELVRFSGNTYTTRTHDSLKISNGKWMWWSRGIGGNSALDYLVKVKGLSFLEAVETIMGCKVALPTDYCTPKKETPKELKLPPKSASTDRITEYLFSRGIDYEIITHCIQKGLIFESLPYHNAVFVGKDEKIITRALQKLIKDNDLPPVVFHSLRHSSITYKLKLNGGDIKSVQGDSGHAQVKMVTDVYSHIIDEDRRLNAQRFEETFYQKKNPSEVNGATVEPKKEPQGITEEAMLNYMVQNPDFLQKFKVLLGVGN